ncbi:alpha/beta hydrolase [Sesbania bispinosa]|nr:alpha/beta hydrolase [Sesbania bispinosa]
MVGGATGSPGWGDGKPKRQMMIGKKILVAVETTFFSVFCGRNIALLRSLQVNRLPSKISFRCGIVQLQNRFVADDFGVAERYLETRIGIISVAIFHSITS